jgi:hypothetical protein
LDCELYEAPFDVVLFIKTVRLVAFVPRFWPQKKLIIFEIDGNGLTADGTEKRLKKDRSVFNIAKKD